ALDGGGAPAEGGMARPRHAHGRAPPRVAESVEHVVRVAARAAEGLTMHPVSLVGAGPGDPELLTRRAARRLAEADLVLYDALVLRDTLELAPRAQRFFVGKRAGRPGTPQETINRLMIRAARRGRRVVRLKCG